MNHSSRVLISEDTKLWQDIFKRLLTERGYQIDIAATLEDTEWHLTRVYYDLVLVDICLDDNDESNQDGVETMSLIRQTSASTEAIVLTGYGTVELVVQALKDFEVFHFLEKDKFEASDFLSLVEAAIKESKIKYNLPSNRVEPLSYFKSIDLSQASSSLGIPEDRLHFVLRHLIRRTSPIQTQESAYVTKSNRGEVISLDYWSKQYGCGAHLDVGRRDVVTITDQANVLAYYEEGEIHGLVEAQTNRSFEGYFDS